MAKNKKFQEQQQSPPSTKTTHHHIGENDDDDCEERIEAAVNTEKAAGTAKAKRVIKTLIEKYEKKIVLQHEELVK